MRKSGDRLINSVTDLVEISKLDSGIQTLSEENVQLNEELQTFIKEQKRRSINPDVLFEYEIGPGIEDLQIVIDRIKLFQVLKNLVDNAFKFTAKGMIQLSVELKDKELVFSVEDSGIGIDPKDYDSIYEPFRQANPGLNRNYEGNGLGLTIAKKLVDKLGGKIWFESEIEKGSFFISRVRLKWCDQRKFFQNNSLNPDLHQLKLAGKKILIAEDDISNYLFFEAVLAKQGCQLVHASNGKEAVEIFANDPTFDIIIMDIKMPVMDGLEATYKIKAIRKTSSNCGLFRICSE